ncbi:hypothetical protein QTP88_009356 [Uroleucon formosanum]
MIQSVNINLCALLTIINNAYIILTFKYKLIPHDENYNFKGIRAIIRQTTDFCNQCMWNVMISCDVQLITCSCFCSVLLFIILLK